jgi:excisionase family DNA binding protein
MSHLDDLVRDSIERLTVRIPEAGQMLSVSRATIYRLLAAGEIEAIKSRHSRLIVVDSLRTYVARKRSEH